MSIEITNIKISNNSYSSYRDYYHHLNPPRRPWVVVPAEATTTTDAAVWPEAAAPEWPPS